MRFIIVATFSMLASFFVSCSQEDNLYKKTESISNASASFSLAEKQSENSNEPAYVVGLSDGDEINEVPDQIEVRPTGDNKLSFLRSISFCRRFDFFI